MPPEAFLMSGGAAPFRPAGACPVSDGPHEGDEAFVVADVATRDGSASVRVALWRCRWCGTVMAGLGRTDADPAAAPGYGIHVQEFAWLESAEAVAMVGSGPARQVSDHRAGGEPGGG